MTQPQVTSRLREYLNIFTGSIPEYRDEETTGYLARIYSNGNGNPGQLRKTFEEHNVSGHLYALLLVAQVARGSADGSDASKGASQQPNWTRPVTEQLRNKLSNEALFPA